MFRVLQLIQSVFSLIQESESEPDISESHWFNHLRRKKMQLLNLFLTFPKITEKKMKYVTTLHRKKKLYVFKHLENDTRREKQGFSLSLTCSPLHFLGIKLKSEQELNVLMWLRGVWRQIQVLTPRLFVCQLQAEQQWNISLKHDDFISKV